MTQTVAPVDRAALIERYERNRARTRALFSVIRDEAYYSSPISARHPVVFYEGHLPAFSFNTLVKRALGGASIDPALETLFARGIDPSDFPAKSSPISPTAWPARRVVQQFVEEADRRVRAALSSAVLDEPGHPLLDAAGAVHAILEHEAMHQETLSYLWHRLPIDQKRRPDDYSPVVECVAPAQEWIDVPEGDATLGVPFGSIPFGWDNEFGALHERVPPFAIQRHDVTNAAYLKFVDAGGYEDPRWWRRADWEALTRESVQHPLFWERHGREWYWRGMFDRIPLPAAWPVYVSQAEAAAYAAWQGARLPTEAEFQRAAYGTAHHAERSWPWGDLLPTGAHGVFDFVSWDPHPAGSHPDGRSHWGVDDLVGNGWEWTSTVFRPFPGFRPMPAYPEYSADFFDDEHFVLKGASPATARELLRPTFRNWFRPRYPYVYATFRCARSTR